MFDGNTVPYKRHTIIQSSHLGEQLEKLHLKNYMCRVAPLYIKNMYPSMKLRLILAAIHHFSIDFIEENLE